MNEIELIRRSIAARPNDPGVYRDAVAVLYEGVQRGEDWHAVNREIRRKISGVIRECTDRASAERLNDTYYKSLLIDAPVDFDAYCQYLEKNRDVRKRFYLPRRKQLLPVVKSLQRLMDDELDLLGISLPPGVGKTTLAIFLPTWVAGRWPEEPNLTGSHSNAFVRGVYDECLRIFDENGEYLWHDVFPGSGVSSTNAKDYRIDLGKRKRFETLEFTSIGSGNAGLYRAGRLLYCDDLISGLEIALSKERLDKLWETYTTDLRQRKIGDHCKELHIATRWSVNDVIGRLERQYEGTDRAEFIAVPALNADDESNFEYLYGVGFSTAFYHEQREVMADTEWRALYMNQPIEREGLLYHPDELRRYFELPEREPDAILCVCDTKDKGADYCAMPIAYQYGQDYYIEDVVFNNGNPENVMSEIITKLLKHKVHMGRFESNSAGGMVAQKVQEEVKKRGGRTKLTTKFTTQNKETKIIMASPYVKEHFLFKDDGVIAKAHDKEYRSFLNNMCSWTMNGKAKHDDGPDSIAMLADYVQNFTASQAVVFARPF
jgi:predicted phage terminase large subunit-like protein